jgi:glucose-1-phosphate thymidylyltransferase
MNALILAGGEATRLAPLTDRIPKPLLPLGGKPMLEHIYDRLLRVGSIACIHILTSHRSFEPISAWAAARARPLPIRIHNNADGSDFDRSGTIPGMVWVLRRASIADRRLLMITGDSYIDYSLAEFVTATESEPEATWFALHPTTDAKLIATYDSMELAPSGRVTRIVDPGPAIGERLLRTGIVFVPAGHLPFFTSYLDAGLPVSKGSAYTRWLLPRAPLCGRRMAGAWIDAGTPHELLAADNAVRARTGLPLRDVYVPE